MASSPIEVWQAVTAAGGIDAYVDEQLRSRGYLVERRETEGMGKAELKRYKAQLKAEAKERRELRKAAWQAYKSTHIVHVGESIWFNDDHDLDRYDLPDAEARADENQLPALDSPQQLAEALELTVPELRWLSFHREAATSTHYTPFTIPKRDGSERRIWAPRPKLKAAQRWILRNIVERLPVHGAAHGFLMGRSVATNASQHTNAGVVIKVDLKDFFPTVSFRRVKGVFRKAGYRERVATLLALLCTESPREIVEDDGKTFYVATGPRCLPQGAPTSPAITNTLCMRLDRRLTGLAESLGWRYTRYADDLTFSRPKDEGGKAGKKAKSKKSRKGEAKSGPKKGIGIATLIGVVTRIAAEEGFEVKASKTRVARKGGRQQITGLVVNDEHGPRTPRKLRRELRAAVHNLEQGKGLKDGESIERLKGLAAWVYMTQPQLGRSLLARIDAAESGAAPAE